LGGGRRRITSWKRRAQRIGWSLDSEGVAEETEEKLLFRKERLTARNKTPVARAEGQTGGKICRRPATQTTREGEHQSRPFHGGEIKSLTLCYWSLRAEHELACQSDEGGMPL